MHDAVTNDVDDSSDTLPDALARHGFDLPAEQVERLGQYCELLWEWNARLNLTRHTTYEKFVSRDLVDVRVLAEQLQQGERVLDVGAGGGVPGVPLAIVRPDLRMALSESVAKRAKALEDIVARMPLTIPVHHARAEELVERASFDTLIARAVAPLPKLLTWFAPHWSCFKRLLVIKGPAWIDERAEARHRGLLRTLELRKLAAYPLSGLDKESVVLEIRPKAAAKTG